LLSIQISVSRKQCGLKTTSAMTGTDGTVAFWGQLSVRRRYKQIVVLNRAF
jgi:hypothetical protein